MGPKMVEVFHWSDTSLEGCISVWEGGGGDGVPSPKNLSEPRGGNRGNTPGCRTPIERGKGLQLPAVFQHGQPNISPYLSTHSPLS
jgi:hypothetical protein